MTDAKDDSLFDNYRWAIIVAGICGLLASLGIGRFALGMLLPGMGAALHLSYSQMGTISTLNFCGYLGAVLVSGRLVERFGPKMVISLALVLVCGSMVLVGVSSSYYAIMVLYCLTGIGSALSNVPIMALIAVWFAPTLRGRALGMVVIGNGIGIILSGHLVPVLNGSHHGWRLSWVVFGALALLMSAVCSVLIKNTPPKGVLKVHRVSLTADSDPKRNGRLMDTKNVFLLCAGIYFLFGFTYVIYATFFVTSLVQERGLLEQQAGVLWSWVGAVSLVSGPLFGYLSDVLGRKAGLMSVFFIQATAYFCATALLPEPFLYASIVCFGIVAWSIPSIMAALIGDYAGPERTTAVFGFVTFVFGVGQIIGPYFAGLLAEITHGFSASFLMASLFALAAVGLSAMIPGPLIAHRQKRIEVLCHNQANEY